MSGDRKERGQTLSFDVLIAVSVFIVAVIFMVYLFLRPDRPVTLEALAQEGEVISGQLVSSSESSETAVVIRNRLDKERLQSLAGLSYDELKGLLGVEGDFCIHFEDEQGNLIDIDDSAVTRYSIGSPKLNFTVLDAGTESVLACGS